MLSVTVIRKTGDIRSLRAPVIQASDRLLPLCKHATRSRSRRGYEKLYTYRYEFYARTLQTQTHDENIAYVVAARG